MGSPRQTFAGETRLSRQCRWPRAAKGRSASHFKMYPGLLEQPRPCLSNPINQGGRGEGEDTEKEHGIVFFTLHLREIFISPLKKIRPHPTHPQKRLHLGRRSVADCLSRSNHSRKLKPSKKKKKEKMT